MLDPETFLRPRMVLVMIQMSYLDELVSRLPVDSLRHVDCLQGSAGEFDTWAVCSWKTTGEQAGTRTDLCIQL